MRTTFQPYNYASLLLRLDRYGEAKSLLRKTLPVARRVLGECDRLTLKMRQICAMALYLDDGATLDDICEAVSTLDETARIARRVFGSSHPLTKGIEQHLDISREVLRARETGDVNSLREVVANAL